MGRQLGDGRQLELPTDDNYFGQHSPLVNPPPPAEDEVRFPEMGLRPKPQDANPRQGGQVISGDNQVAPWPSDNRAEVIVAGR